MEEHSTLFIPSNFSYGKIGAKRGQVLPKSDGRTRSKTQSLSVMAGSLMLYQWLLTRVILSPPPLPGEVWPCLEIFALSQLGCAIGIQWVKARDAAKHLTVHRTTPQQRTIWP